MKYLYIHNAASSVVDEATYPTTMFTPTDLRTRDYSVGASNNPDYTSNLIGHGDRNYAPLALEDDIADLWFHFRFKAAAADTFQLSFFAADATAMTDTRVFEITTGGTDTIIQVSHGSNSYIDTTGLFNQTDEVEIDVQVRRPSGETTLYVNGVERVVVTEAAAGTISAATVGQLRINAVSGANSIPAEVIITENIPTIGMRVITLDPEANGSENTLDGDINSINTVGLTADAMVETTAATHTYLYGDISPNVDLNGLEVKAVAIGSVASRDVLNVNDQMHHVVKQNGVVHEIGTGHDVDTLSHTKGMLDVLTVSPDTGEQWTFQEIADLEAGSKFSNKP